MAKSKKVKESETKKPEKVEQTENSEPKTETAGTAGTEMENSPKKGKKKTILIVLGVIFALFLFSNLFGSSAEKRELDALWYKTEANGEAKGGTSEVKIVLDKNKGGDVTLGFYETEVGGAGEMWRASGWMGTTISALMTKKDINRYKIDFTTKGRIDGPSAGALMTVGILAALQDHKIDDKVTMTGTVNPDGTIGPVGGIAHKLGGAKEAGKKVILIPISQRYEIDEKTGDSIDLLKKGKELGLEIKEVATIHEAYKEFTGKTLPRANKNVSEPDFSPESYDKIKLKVNAWQAEYDEINKKIGSYNPQIVELLGEEVQKANQEMEQAKNWMNQGEVSAAYYKSVSATMQIAVLESGMEIMNLILTNGVDGLDNYIESTHSTSKRVDVLVEKLAVEKIESFDDLVAVSEAYSNFGTALGLVQKAELAKQELATMEDQEKATEKAVEVALYYMVSKYTTTVAEDALDFAKTGEGPRVPKTKKLKSWTTVMRRSAEANQQYFDSIVIDEVAKEMSASTESVKVGLAQNDLNYLESVVSTNVIEQIQEEIKDDLHKSAAAFGLATNGFANSSAVIAKYYSLDAQLDEENNITGFGREKALTSMLENAISIARGNIADAQKAGADTTIATFHYKIGKAYREGDQEDKLSALEEFWKASLYARMSVILLD